MAFTLWMTGISGAGKTTLSIAMEKVLKSYGIPCRIFDGDDVRKYIGTYLGFERHDRELQTLYLGYIAKEMNAEGVSAIVASIAPFSAARKANRASIPSYVEVFCDCPVSLAALHDVKGLYLSALQGAVPCMTGIDSPYEEPSQPDIHIRTYIDSVDDAVQRIMHFLEDRNFISLSCHGAHSGTVTQHDKNSASKTVADALFHAIKG